MRKTLFLTAILLAGVGYAQRFEDFGRPKSQDFQIKECSFDPDAPAIILLDEAISDHNDQYNLITEYRIRLKILKESGIAYSDIVIPFWRKDGFEVIDQVQAVTVNITADGSSSTSHVERKAIYLQNVDDRQGTVKFAFPDVRVGSILEYRYRSTKKHYGGLEDWYFQKRLPVVLSKYNLTILPNYEFTYQIKKRPDYQVKVTPNSHNGTIEFEMRNIPGLDEEEYMDARRDYLQQVKFQLSATGSGIDRQKHLNSWDEVSRYLLSEPDFGGQLDKDIGGAQEFVKIAKSLPTPEERIRQVLQYVRNNLQWNNYNSYHSPQGVKQTWSKKSGTSGDINLVLVNLLKSCDLTVYPLLISERDHGQVNTQYPFLDQFNKVFALVKIGNRNYYLDASDPITPYHMIPYGILNTIGYVVHKKEGGLVTIKDDEIAYRNHIVMLAQLQENGTLKGEAVVRSLDYARVSHVREYLRSKEHHINKNFRYNPRVQIDSFVVTNLAEDTLELKQKFIFSAPLTITGDYTFIPLTSFTGFENNPFVSSKRFTNVNFGYKRLITLDAHFILSDQYAIDAIPKSIRLVNADKTIIFTRQMFVDEETRKVVGRLRIEINKSLFPVDEYPALREFYKKMFDYLTEPIVLKKKTTP